MDRKGFHKLALILLALVLSLHGQAQNLVPNPSFEEHLDCPYLAQIWMVPPWQNVRGSCDYYHECGTNGFGVPINRGGGGYARTGQAYSQFNVWTLNQTFELLGVELISELEGGKRYHVEFYLSMQDSLWYASKNVGVYFSVEQPVNNVDSIESYQPQVRYEGDFITDKEGWTLVAGSFVAKGGEQFITIGNFDTYEETEILFVPGGGVPPSHSATFWEAAGYFIDDVSVIPDSITSVHEVLNVERSYKHYPNPNTGAFTVEMKLLEGEVAQLLVWNVSGQQVHSQMLNNGINALEMDAAKGLYLYGITVNGATQWNGKIVVTSE